MFKNKSSEKNIWSKNYEVSEYATTCFSCNPSDLNFLDPYFIFMYMHYNHCHRATAHLQLNILLLLLLFRSAVKKALRDW